MVSKELPAILSSKAAGHSPMTRGQAKRNDFVHSRVPPPSGVIQASRGERSPRLFFWPSSPLCGGLVLGNHLLRDLAGQLGQMIELHFESANALGERA